VGVYTTTFNVKDVNDADLHSITFNACDGVGIEKIVDSPFTYIYTELGTFYPTFKVPGFIGKVQSIVITETGQSVDVSLVNLSTFAKETTLEALANVVALDATVAKEATLSSLAGVAALDATVAKEATLSALAGVAALDATVAKEASISSLAGIVALDSTVAKDATVAKESTLNTLSGNMALDATVAKEATLSSLAGVAALDATVAKESSISSLSGIVALNSTVAKDSTVAKESTLSTLAGVAALNATVAKEATLNSLAGTVALDSTVAKDATVAKESTLTATTATINAIDDQTSQMTFNGDNIQARVADKGVFNSLSETTIRDAIWNAVIADYQTSGSTGEALEEGRLHSLYDNLYIDQPVYSSNNVLTSCRVRIYSDPVSVGTTSDVLATYVMTATESAGKVLTYKTVKQ
jgi:hypothetical protein